MSDRTQSGLDSRKVIKGTAFVAIKGVAQDGHAYISKAIELGAKVIVCENIVFVVCSNRLNTCLYCVV